MRALVLHGFGDTTIEEVPDPVPGPDEVVIDVACVQPSVTECMLIAGDPVAMHDVLTARLAAGPTRFGGHEFAGTISATGSGVAGATVAGGAAGSGLTVGARVTAVETAACGTCAACRRDRPDACRSPGVLGFTRPGAFAERVAVPAKSVVAVPDGVTASQAAAGGALHGHAIAEVRPGDTVLILGAGVMGVLHTQVARHGGAGQIIVTGRSPAKRRLALRAGADLVVDAAGDVLAAVLDATDGIGADVVFETAGGMPSAGLAGTSTLDLAARCVRRGGRIVMVAVLPRHASAPLGLLRERSVALLHPRSGAGGYSPSAGAFEQALRLVRRGDVDVDCLVTHRLDGIDALPKALDITRDKAAHGAAGPAQVTVGAWDAA
ncbi:alcohol dehydrogenase catalytic domain-containing protein [Dactylosporangium sp. NBC_01737]|uniref:zinc-dependent alcohol dehydrogenase n=1 Tax=Dactylosporangium sp. NBC_01737 TaxID=2975959 RepID=UPI002E15B277|nr:alcohol dehydrogenase catalytic domain-containing protein [Dactylosporangium sp. NBC_01737]